MRAIFISYRREDAEGQAGRLFNDLSEHFGEDSVFMDVAGIAPGRDFRRVIDEHVASCSVLLAMIGKQWLDAKDDSGRLRLEDPTDFVRLETASALKRDIPVIPVLVHGASMPRAEQLPADLAELAYRNGVELTHARWDSDVQLLIKALRTHVPSMQVDADSAKPEPVSARPKAGTAGTVRPSGEPAGVLKFLTENLAEFFEVATKTLVRPVAHFRPTSSATISTPLAADEGHGQSRWFDPKLFTFAGFSIIVGTLINGLIPGRDQGSELLATVIFTLVGWFAYSTGIYWLCKLLRGQGSYAETMAVSIQLLATLFVVASTLTLGLAAIAQVDIVKLLVDDTVLEFLLADPIYFFFGIEAILLAVYLPLALKHVHRFGWVRQVCIGVVPFVTMWGGVLFYASTRMITAA